MAANFQDGGYCGNQTDNIRKLIDHRYCIKLKGNIHDHTMKSCGQALLVCIFFYFGRVAMSTLLHSKDQHQGLCPDLGCQAVRSTGNIVAMRSLGRHTFEY